VKPLGRFVLIFHSQQDFTGFPLTQTDAHPPTRWMQTISSHKINLATTKNKGIKETKPS
jgi:hypothetical protein